MAATRSAASPDAVLDDRNEWQARPFEKLYLVVWLDAIVLKIRAQGSVRNRHAYLAIGVGIEGTKEMLGIWLEPNEGAKFWRRVISELKAREDILVFSVDGLKGFPEAIEAVYPQAIVQTCIAHMIRNSLRFTSHKHRKQLVKDLRTIHTAPSEEAAEQGLDTFAGTWDSRYPQISQPWRGAWERVIPCFAFTFHTLRHTFASMLIVGLKLDPVSVSRQLGHRSVSITLNTYAHLFEQAKAADEMRERLETGFGHLLRFINTPS